MNGNGRNSLSTHGHVKREFTENIYFKFIYKPQITVLPFAKGSSVRLSNLKFLNDFNIFIINLYSSRKSNEINEKFFD